MAQRKKNKQRKQKFYEIGNPDIPCLKNGEHSYNYISYNFITTNHETMNRYVKQCVKCGKLFLDTDKFNELKECCNKYSFVANEVKKKKMKLQALQDLVNKRFKESKIYVLSKSHVHALTYQMPVRFKNNIVNVYYCKECDGFFCKYDDVKSIKNLPDKFIFSKASIRRKKKEKDIKKLKEKQLVNKIESDIYSKNKNMTSAESIFNEMFAEKNELEIIDRIDDESHSVKKYGFKYVDCENQRLVEMNVYMLNNKNYILKRDYIKNSVYGNICANLIGDVPELPKREIKKAELDLKKVILYVKTSNRKCVNGHHHLDDIKMNIELRNDNNHVVTKQINVFHCTECNINYIYDDAYYDLVRFGQPTCLIIDETIYKNLQRKGTFNFSADSILTLYGYNVNQNMNLSIRQRQNILKSLIDTKIIKKAFAVEHLKFLINSRKRRPNHKLAISKWKEDVDFLENYNFSNINTNNTIDRIIIQKKI